MKVFRSIPLGAFKKPCPRKKIRPAIVPPIPRPFDFGFTARRPLVPLAAVTMFLDMNTRQVMSLIEEGRLRWAFDIRTERASTRTVRVLRQSLFEFTGLYAPEKIVGDTDAEFARVVKWILPRGKKLSRPIAGAMALSLSATQALFTAEPVLAGTELAQCFSCNAQHVLNLLRENLFQPVNLRRSAKASPLVTRSSVIAFLKARRIS